MGKEYMTRTGTPFSFPGIQYPYCESTLIASVPDPKPMSLSTFISVILPSFSIIKVKYIVPLNPVTFGIL